MYVIFCNGLRDTTLLSVLFCYILRDITSLSIVFCYILRDTIMLSDVKGEEKKNEAAWNFEML